MRLSRLPSVVGACLVLLSMSLAVGRTASDSHMARQVSGIGDLRLKVGEPFLHARSRIIRLGWKPVPMHRDDNYEYSGAEKRLAERSIREVDSCSIDAGANCILYYQKKAECLRVDTVGEQVNEMKITRWTNECPPAKS